MAMAGSGADLEINRILTSCAFSLAEYLSTEPDQRRRPRSPMQAYRAKRDAARRSVLSSYTIQGFLSSGTYGRVYKARTKGGPHDGGGTGSAGDGGGGELVAIKKFKPDKEGEAVTYTGISQSACREIMINRELNHENLVALREVILEDKSIYMVFEYAEHDFLQIIHHHSSTKMSLPEATLKSLLWQLLNGVAYLHDNWIIHRDLKPANILVTANGVVKIGDLGLARVYHSPLQSLYTSDKVVVTIWYRSPDLLLGARHYTPSVDIWSVGCIFGELLALRPMFKGEEAKPDAAVTGPTGKKTGGGVPFQRDQLSKIFEILGPPNKQRWSSMIHLPDYSLLASIHIKNENTNSSLFNWFKSKYPRSNASHPPSSSGFDFMSSLLTYDPAKRPTAKDALTHKWWAEEPKPKRNSFWSLPPNTYPFRRVTNDDMDPKLVSTGAAPRSYGSGKHGLVSVAAMAGGGSGSGGAGNGGGGTTVEAGLVQQGVVGGRASKRQRLG